MGVRRVEVKTYHEFYHCDHCGGNMTSTGVALLSSPELYPHRCENNHTITLDSCYPRVITVPVEETS